MWFDRFDIVEAYYLFFVHYHDGQNSEKYARLSKMSDYFEPAANLGVGSLTENGLEIYNNLIEKENKCGT